MAIQVCLAAMILWLGPGLAAALGDVSQPTSPPQTQTAAQSAPSDSKQDAPRLLRAGDKPPALSVDKWIKGGPIARFEKGKVYVVEFWATWCKPCLEGIPRLTELQRRYGARGLVAIGVASHEFKGTKTLSRFVQRQGEKMTYAVAYDGDGSMERQWQTRGIPGRGFTMPQVFVIDTTGKIAWVGHPNSEKGQKLAKIVADLLGSPAEVAPTDERKHGAP